MDKKADNRRVFMIGVLVYAGVVFAGFCALEIFTDAKIFSESIVGIIIGSVATLLGSFATFYTQKLAGDKEKKDG